MSILNFITDAISGVGSAVSKVIDSLHADDSEKNKIKRALNEQLSDLKTLQIQSQDALEKEITERLKIDMTSDSWLSKNIRPLTLAFNTVSLFIMIILNAAGISFADQIISMFSGLLMLQYGFYFGSRGLEKITAIKNGKNLISGTNKIKEKLGL